MWVPLRPVSQVTLQAGSACNGTGPVTIRDQSLLETGTLPCPVPALSGRGWEVGGLPRGSGGEVGGRCPRAPCKEQLQVFYSKNIKKQVK